MFLGYCGDGENKKSENWLSTSDLQNLVAPADIQAACQSSGRIKITWNAGFDTVATHLEIYRKTSTGTDEFVKIEEVAVDAGIYSDTVINNTYYVYRAKAVVLDDDETVQYLSPDFSPQTNQARASTNCGIVIDADEDTTVGAG